MDMRDCSVAIRGDSCRVPVGVSAPWVRRLGDARFAVSGLLAGRLLDVPFARAAACQSIRHALSQKVFRTVLPSGSPLPQARHFLSIEYRTTVSPRNAMIRAQVQRDTSASGRVQTQRNQLGDVYTVA